VVTIAAGATSYAGSNGLFMRVNVNDLDCFAGILEGAGLIQQHKWLKDKSIIKQHYNFSEIGDSKQGKLDGCEDGLWMWSCGYAELGVQGVNGFKIKDC